MKKLLMVLMILYTVNLLYASEDVEKIIIYDTTIELDKDCNLTLKQKNGKEEIIKTPLYAFEDCHIVKRAHTNIRHIEYLRPYGDYVFYIEGRIINKEKQCLSRFIPILVETEKGHVYLKKYTYYNKEFGDCTFYPMLVEKYQFRIEEYQIRKDNKLDLKLIEVKHNN